MQRSRALHGARQRSKKNCMRLSGGLADHCPLPSTFVLAGASTSVRLSRSSLLFRMLVGDWSSLNAVDRSMEEYGVQAGGSGPSPGACGRPEGGVIRVVGAKHQATSCDLRLVARVGSRITTHHPLLQIFFSKSVCFPKMTAAHGHCSLSTARVMPSCFCQRW